jgi:hypothetical protein
MVIPGITTTAPVSLRFPQIQKEPHPLKIMIINKRWDPSDLD